MGTLAERPYWPSGVKLDSKIIIANDVAVRHEVRWILTWDDVSAFFATDYYAHDLYMDKTGGTFLELASLSITGTLPLVQGYRSPMVLPICGWAGPAIGRTKFKQIRSTRSRFAPPQQTPRLMIGQKMLKLTAYACHLPVSATVCGFPSPGAALRPVGRPSVYSTMPIQMAFIHWVYRSAAAIGCCFCL